MKINLKDIANYSISHMKCDGTFNVRIDDYEIYGVTKRDLLVLEKLLKNKKGIIAIDDKMLIRTNEQYRRQNS